MSANPRSREKQITLDRFLQDDHAMLHIVPSRPGVEIPEHLIEQTTVTLKVSRLFRGRLTITEGVGIEAELLFSNEYFTCKVPFDAIWAVTSSSGQMRMWPEDTPEEILASLAAPAGATSMENVSAAESDDAKSSAVGAEKKRPALRRVK